MSPSTTVEKIFKRYSYHDILLDSSVVMFVLWFRSWQNLKFEKQPVAFVKIVGTNNTANEVGIHSKSDTFKIKNRIKNNDSIAKIHVY